MTSSAMIAPIIPKMAHIFMIYPFHSCGCWAILQGEDYFVLVYFNP